jgi:hypothetical protein
MIIKDGQSSHETVAATFSISFPDFSERLLKASRLLTALRFSAFRFFIIARDHGSSSCRNAEFYSEMFQRQRNRFVVRRSDGIFALAMETRGDDLALSQLLSSRDRIPVYLRRLLPRASRTTRFPSSSSFTCRLGRARMSHKMIDDSQSPRRKSRLAR